MSRRRRTVWPLVGVGIAGGLIGAGCVALRVMPTLQIGQVPGLSRDALAIASAFLLYGLGCWLVAFIALLLATLRARRRIVLAVLTVLCLGGLVLQTSWVGPFFVPDRRPATTPTFTIMSLNLYNGSADPRQIVAAARHADIVVLVELTAAESSALRSAGWSRMFPYRVGDSSADQSASSAVYSRWPVTQDADLQTSFQQWVTTVQVPHLGPVTVAASHPCNPTCGAARWNREAADLQRAALAKPDRPIIIAGDFNAVPDHLPVQRLHGEGFRDAEDVAGSGLVLTWPANRRYPPLVAIDHIMINNRLTSTQVRGLSIDGTDHRGLIATLAGTG